MQWLLIQESFFVLRRLGRGAGTCGADLGPRAARRGWWPERLLPRSHLRHATLYRCDGDLIISIARAFREHPISPRAFPLADALRMMASRLISSPWLWPLWCLGASFPSLSMLTLCHSRPP